VETLNRGLDQAHEAREDQSKLKREQSRNLTKVTEIENRYPAVRHLIDRHLRRR
jgi:hypothetical protein